MFPRRVLVYCVILLPVTLGHCTTWSRQRAIVPASQAGALNKGSPFLKAHMRNGEVYLLSEWTVAADEESVSGKGDRLDSNRKVVETSSFTVPLDSIVLFETNVIQKSRRIRALSVMTGVSATATAVCAAVPKACFGSCPTFYVTDGEKPLLQAEGFSASIAPALEATDIDALYRAAPGSKTLDVRMANEALETHVVRKVNILAIRRGPGQRILRTADGAFWTAEKVIDPTRCLAPEGDCRAQIADFDGIERFSRSDEKNLAARENIDLEFECDDCSKLGLAIAARQTFMSTFLLYQTLGYMGTRGGEIFAALERGDKRLVDRASGMGRILGGIEVLIQNGGHNGGAWVRAGEFRETGPLASDVQLIPLPGVPDRNVRVRLRASRGHWRIDQVSLVNLGKRVEAIRVEPSSVTSLPVTKDLDATDARALLLSGEGLATTAGDEYTFRFELPDGGDYELFLETRGYYLEWIRDEWIAEENLSRARMVLRNPRKALRVLAPEFKKIEPEIEEIFWRSKYAPH